MPGYDTNYRKNKMLGVVVLRRALLDRVLVACVLLAFAGLSGCGGASTSSTGKGTMPGITSFAANPTEITSGASATLSCFLLLFALVYALLAVRSAPRPASAPAGEESRLVRSTYLPDYYQLTASSPAKAVLDRAVRPTANSVGAAIGDIKLCPVPARVKPVRSDAGWNEVRLSERIAVNQVHAVRAHVGDKKGRTVG